MQKSHVLEGKDVLLFCVEWLVRNLGEFGPISGQHMLSWDNWHCGVDGKCSEPPQV